jgi:Fur family ferric uptake transcriptional regulator
MEIARSEARKILHESGLRATPPRLAALRVLAESEGPLSCGDVLARLGDRDWDSATVFRSLVKLRDAGIAPVVTCAGGIDRYALAAPEGDGHRHPHFLCVDCGRVACLPVEVTASLSADGPWALSVAKASVEMRGHCPDCLE